MDRSVRAAQFSPFAALTGYEAAIRETGRLTDRFVELEEYEKALLDEKLQQVRLCLPERPTVTVTYFQPDEQKEGGAYVQTSGAVRRIDEHKRVLVMVDGMEIMLDRMADLMIANSFEKFRTNLDSNEE